MQTQKKEPKVTTPLTTERHRPATSTSTPSSGGCRTGTGHTNSGLWIFTRAQARSESLVQTVRGKLKRMGFDLDALRDVRQAGCPE